MNGIVIAIAAYALLGLSLVIDKVLLRRRVTGSSITYVFWIGVGNSALILVALYRFVTPSIETAALGILAGFLFLAASRFYFGALERGEATQAPTVVGAFTPIATALWSLLFLSGAPLTVADKIAFVVLVAGGLLMFLSEQGRHRSVLSWVFAASLCYGAANVVQKIVFSRTDTMTALALYGTGMLLGAIALLLRRSWRMQIFQQSAAASPQRRSAYLANRIIASAGVLGVLIAIKFEHPAIVDAIAGTRAIVAFLLVLLISHWKPRLLMEHLRGRELWGKIAATVIIVGGLLVIGAQRYYERRPLPAVSDLRWGVTFSELMARRLRLDPPAVLDAIIRDLRPSGLRLIAYWDATEPEDDVFDWSHLDWQMQKARDAQIPVIIALGQKAPRWPECHFPSWLKTEDHAVREAQLLHYIQATVQRYKNDPALAVWQIENEPFLLFGQCPLPRTDTIDQEIALVRSLDSAHPILMTDGGEFGDWYRTARRGDIFGTTLYRKVYNRIFGYITYPLTPEFYPLKLDAVRWLVGRPDLPALVIELGLEPWALRQIEEMTPDEQRALFSLEDFVDNISYAHAARFDTYYVWGAEWWYALKTQADDSRYWDLARAKMNTL